MIISILTATIVMASTARASDCALPSLQTPLSEAVIEARDLACQTQCKHFWKKFPAERPKAGEAPFCRSASAFLESIPRTIGPNCWTGIKDGFSPLQHLLGYALLVRDIGSALRQQMAERREFFAKAEADPQFRLGLVRMLSQYSARNSSGAYVIKDEDLPRNLVDGDLPMLSLLLQKDQSSREKACSIVLEQLAAKWENSGLDGNALATRRYQTIASRSPECIGALNITIPPDSNGAPDPQTANLSCLSPERIESAICKEAASFASDPFARLPATMLLSRGIRALIK